MVRRYWGFEDLRPLQEEAIRAGLDQRDSLVVLPTGGGKSLCYQVPPVVGQRTDVVVSPLISLMKDQVDGLRACGYPAAALHSGLSPEAQREVMGGIAQREYRLIFVSPERLLTSWFGRMIENLEVQAFAIDEAHCISHWGHDFRPEYRRLASLKERFPKASVHGYTATATERVQADVIQQLGLTDPAVLVGQSDRPNLIYRVVPRVDRQRQVLEAIRRHAGEAVIVYCIRRSDTESLAVSLQSKGVRAEAYHAGLESDKRRRIQEAFAQEQLNVVVATVAFGMGIDRSNVRCVVHAALPKSIEHYQQETGRAGRDGLEAECVLLYSAADVMRWDSLLTRSAEEGGVAPEVLEASRELLGHMRRFAGGLQCRHRALSEYFGQAFEKTDCGACDVCLDEVAGVEDATVTAQKIISCVARVRERFGVGYIVDVLLGAETEQIQRWGHHRLSTFGLMKGTPRKAVQNMTFQLVDQGLLTRGGDKPVLGLNDASWAVLRGHREVRLFKPKAEVARSKVDADSWAGVDAGLFEHLRGVRRELAQQRGVPPYLIFNDVTLREMARLRPVSPEGLRMVIGVGTRKLADFGARLADEIAVYCRTHGLTGFEGGSDGVSGGGDGRVKAAIVRDRPGHGSAGLSPARQQAFQMFADGFSLENVMTAVTRKERTVLQYLVEYIQAERPERIDAWVDDGAYRVIAAAAQEVGMQKLKPIFERLGGAVPYETIRLVVRHLEVRAARGSGCDGGA